MHRLESKLRRLNKTKYNLYHSLLGEYDFPHFRLRIDKIQADPFAPPSQATLFIPFETTGFSSDFLKNKIYTLSFCDSLARVIAEEGRRICKENRGSGNGGLFGIRYGQQKVIEGNAVLIRAGMIEVRILIGLPGYGRSIAAKEAEEFLLKEIPQIVEASCSPRFQEKFLKAAQLLQRQHWLRELCCKENIIAFVGNNSVLARLGGSDKPFPKALAFSSPKEWEKNFVLPDGFCIKGMAFPRGVSIIIGGAYHGKSTLLAALSQGIYNHIGGDGREFCLCDQDALFLRAEDRRPVAGADLSPFLRHLPLGKSTTFFESDSASGSTSQAANLIEGLEAGSRTFLIDEDISATNFLVRGNLMSQLVPEDKESIKPLSSLLHNLKKAGLSFIIVSGALDDLLFEADRVLLAENFCYKDATAAAKALVKPISPQPAEEFILKQTREINAESISYLGKKKRVFLEGTSKGFHFGKDYADLSYWPQLMDPSQYGTLAAIIAYAKDRGYLQGTPEDLLTALKKDSEKFGWDLFSDVHKEAWRYTAAVRPVDIWAALCRLRAHRCTASEGGC